MAATLTFSTPKAPKSRSRPASRSTPARGGSTGQIRDPAASPEPDGISYANLNGSGGGTLNTTGATISEPFSVAIDPAGGRVYWTNDFDITDSISYANLDGSGGDDLDTGVTTDDSPIGLAIDGAAHRIYWGNSATESIGSASLAGGEPGGFELAGIDPEGLAIGRRRQSRLLGQPHAERLIGFSSLTGEGQGAIDTTGIEPSYPAFPALLKTPVNTEAPAITKEPKAIVVPVELRQRRAALRRKPERDLRLHQGHLGARSLRSLPLPGAAVDLLPVAAKREADPGSHGELLRGDRSRRLRLPGDGDERRRPDRLGHRLDQHPGRLRTRQADDRQEEGHRQTAGRDVRLRRRRPRWQGPETENAGIAAGRSPGSIVVKAKGKALKRLKAKGKTKVMTELAFTPTNGSPLLATKSITLRLKH